MNYKTEIGYFLMVICNEQNKQKEDKLKDNLKSELNETNNN